MNSQPHLRRYLTRCKHCRIFFLTDPRNRGRRDLGCPFGCREHHRRQCSTRRTNRHYRTEEGKDKKRQLNAKRSMANPCPSTDDQRAEQSTSRPLLPDPRDSTCEDIDSTDEIPLDKEAPIPPETTHRVSVHPAMLQYLCMVTSLIEGRRVSMEEILIMLARIMRQRSMYRTGRIDYVLDYLNKHPP